MRSTPEDSEVRQSRGDCRVLQLLKAWHVYGRLPITEADIDEEMHRLSR
jgi:hypothetical protein